MSVLHSYAVRCAAPLISLIAAVFLHTSAQAAITAVNEGSFGGSAPGDTVTQSITVGASADMLVVMTASELGGLSGDAMTVTYGGVEMNLATGNTDLTQSAIWYLDLSTAGISGTDVVVDVTDYGTRNGFAAGWVTLNGNLLAGESIALHSTAFRQEGSPVLDNTVSLTTTVETFNVVNFNGNGGTQINVVSPDPNVIYEDGTIGSARSAAAYEVGVAAGTSVYEYFINNPDNNGNANANYRRIDAAAFTVIPEPSSIALVGLSGLLLMRRRRG